MLELESQLEKERKRLGDLRRTHYQLAGASEGWEEVAYLSMLFLLKKPLVTLFIVVVIVIDHLLLMQCYCRRKPKLN